MVNYALSGDLTGVDRLFLTLDSDPAIEITNLSGTYTFNNVGQGNHTITAELAMGQTTLTNPEASDVVNFSIDPPTVVITSPQEGSTVSGSSVVVNYNIGGDLVGVDRLFLTLDSDPAIEITNLSGTYIINNLAQGNHTITAELAVGQAILTNPEATDVVNFNSTTVSLPNPLAHWPLDGTGQDIENGHDGTPTNGAAFSTDSRIGSQSMSLDGVNDYLDLVGFSGTGFMHDAFSTRTVTVWLKPGTTSGTMDLFEEGGSGKGFALRIKDGNLEAAIRNGGAGTQTTISTPYPGDGQWHHAGVVFNGGTFDLYLDGVLSATQATGYSAIGNHDDPGAIGVSSSADAFGSGNGSYYQGLIDDVRLYDVALDGAQILTLATEGGTTGPPMVTITSPQEGSTVSGSSVAVNYNMGGDLVGVDRIFLTLDSDPAIEITNLSGTYIINNVGQGNHTISAELAMGQTILTNPEATDVVNFNSTNVSLPSPLAHWPLDGTGQDIENGHDGTPINGASFSSDSQVGSQSMSLDGIDDYLDLVGISSTGFMHDAFSTRTVTVWLKPGTTNGTMDLFDEGGSGKGFTLRLKDGNLEAAIRNGGGGTQTTISTPYPGDGQWHHAGVVFNGGTFDLYLDGVLSATQATGYSAIGNHDDPGAIGVSNGTDAFGSGNGSYYQGLIDDARLYDVALDSDQILELFTTSPGGLPAQAFTSTGELEGPSSNVEDNKIIIYPNPVEDQLNIALELLQKDRFSFRIADLLGRTLDLGNHELDKGKSKISFDITKLNLALGAYYFEIKSKNLTRRFKLYVE